MRRTAGSICPSCAGPTVSAVRVAGGGAWPLRRVLLQCAACGRQTSVTAGTIFQDTRSPLALWFRAMWWVTTQKNGASALGLQRVLGLNRYETAWTWLHKMRRAMVRPGRDLLARRVKNKALIAVAAQEDGRGIGRIRMNRIGDASGESLLPFVEECIEPGSVVHTDGWPGYSGLKMEKYPDAKPRIISDNGPQFIAKDFKEFIRISGMTHVRTSPYYPQSNGKLERWHKSLKSECIRPGVPLTLEDARRLIERYVEHYNTVRLHSAIGFVTPADMLAGRQNEIHATRDRKLEQARQQGQLRRRQAV